MVPDDAAGWIVDGLEGAFPGARAAEAAERKGRGHPDSICDALAEGVSRALSRAYLEHFGRILHHNVDKVLLRGGVARPAYGGGEVTEPFEIYLCGRATRELKGVAVPVDELAIETALDWIRENLPAVDPQRHVRVHCLIRPGSADLTELFQRSSATAPLANDTSAGVGYAPLSALEQAVLAVEHSLTAHARRSTHPCLGQDVKVMGVRRGGDVALTLGCALVDRHVRDAADYVAKKQVAADLAFAAARESGGSVASVVVNAADDPAAESFFLTVTGTSAEAGDDGEAGRGNRANGLISPGRPMTMESLAGKNPVTHVGKLYNLVAGLAAAALVEQLPDVEEARCLLVSRIGAPISQPQLVELRLRCDPRRLTDLRPQAVDVLRTELDRIGELARELVDGTLQLDRWPLRK